MTPDSLIPVAILGFIAGAIGGLGTELLNNFAGRSLEAFCRLKQKRERFGAVLDHQYDAMLGAEYLRVVGNVVFLAFGTAALVIWRGAEFTIVSLALWSLLAGALVMLTHLWLPSAVTRFASSPLLYHTWPFWRTLSVVAAPLSAPGELLGILTRRLAGQTEDDEDEEDILHDEIRKKVTAGSREGYLGKGVREMIQGVLDLQDDTVGHIMTPRSDVDAIPMGMPWDEVMRFVTEVGRTRLPVYHETLDNILGILYVKDLLPEVTAGTLPIASLESMLRRPWYVPIDRSVDSLLREFLHSRSHMAIVLDEFHQTAGVVTIEDALEEIVGEIVDESDDEEEMDLRWIDDDTAEADGRVMIDQLNDRLGWDLPESEDYETVAGFVLHHVGSIPEDGQQLTVGPVTVEVLKASNRQIERLRLYRKNGRGKEAT
jgi:CBS domain containing-hemolysin-like protein